MKQTECLIPTYGELTEQQIALINKNSYVIKHRKGEVIFVQDRPVSHVIFIKSGLLKLYKHLEGKKEIILDIMPANQFVGLTSVFYENLYPYSTSSIGEGELIYTTSSVFRDVIAENGKYALHIMAVLSSRVVYTIDRMIALTRKQVPGRMAEMLLNFSKNTYKNNAFTLPISRLEIADFIQTSKETVSRTLTEFKNDRIIELDDKNVVLKSLDLLEILNRIG
jgi:CRP-like cAMP-binding protein